MIVKEEHCRSSLTKETPFLLGRHRTLTLKDFYDVVFKAQAISLDERAVQRLLETRDFIEYLLKNNISVYGLTTGFGDLRKWSVPSEDAAQLSSNLILSHDGGIGEPFSFDVTLGAMLVRANSLAKGYSGFKLDSLETLIQMINARIIPKVPSTGSLGASGDLAFLARVGRAMKGEAVQVFYKGGITTADRALQEAQIKPFFPESKEGLALTNGTSFMTSMIAIGFLKELHHLENILGILSMYLNTVQAAVPAFASSIQNVRGQKEQSKIAKILMGFLKGSPFANFDKIQDDYSIRCLPQILGPKIEMFLSMFSIIENELNAATDNPLIFKDDEIDEQLKEKIIPFQNSQWAVFSGGNFHGEYLTTVADSLV